jgi:hypothetical protein
MEIVIRESGYEIRKKFDESRVSDYESPPELSGETPAAQFW